MEAPRDAHATSIRGGHWAELQSNIAGKVITPRDPEYDEARRAWDLTVQQWPAAIAVATDAVDVVEAKGN
jgi:hypothetical protein